MNKQEPQWMNDSFNSTGYTPAEKGNQGIGVDGAVDGVIIHQTLPPRSP